MVRKILIIFFATLSLVGSSYMGKIEPIESVAIRSEVSGIVKKIKLDVTYKFITKENVVMLDTSSLDIEIASLINEISNQRKSFRIQKKRFKSKSKIKTISQYEKQQEELSMRQYLQSLYSLQKQLKLKRVNRAKHIFNISHRYIGNIYVKKNEYVSMGSSIMDVYDISKSKIIIYVNKKDIEYIKNKDIYIDNKKSSYKIRYISNITDKIYISSYKVELIKDNKDKNMIFGKVVRVEFKDIKG